MNRIVLTSPAKINLFLDIKGKRPDGYHNVLTWLHTIDLADEIIIEKSKNEYCVLRSHDTTIPFGKRNLCIQAYEAMKAAAELEQPVEISLEKEIPLGSGLAGGSSNAASVIVGTNRMFDLGMSDDRMREIGAKVGTDVPFFIAGGSAIGRGRGAELSQLPPFSEPLWLVLAKPETAVSTGEAYKWIKDYKGDKEIDEKELASKIEQGDFGYICALLYNSFEDVVFAKYPQLVEIRRRLLDEGCAAARMTGSGSTIFGLCENEKTARAVADELAQWDQLSFIRTCCTV